jgi:hypothetical protein
VSPDVLRLLGLLSAKLGPDDLLMQVAAAAEYSGEPALPLTLVLENGTVVEGIVGSDMAMATAADEPIKRPIEDRFRAALARAAPEDAPELQLGVEKLGGRGLVPWLTDLHAELHAASERARSANSPSSWEGLSDSDVIMLTQFTHRTAITIRDARVALPHGRPKAVPVMRVSLASVDCWWVS